MSAEPSSGEMRHRDALGRSGWTAPPAPPPKRDPLRKPQPPSRRRPPRVRVEGAGKDQALAKLLTTTEQLTPYERQIVQGYRLAKGGPEADEVRREIEIEIQEEKR